MASATATVTNFLSNLISNPFSTPVGQLIEKATDVSQASEDWGLYMEICDLINDTEDGPRDAARAFKKQITNNVGKSSTVIMYTLTILETCVKNCHKKFHVQIAQKDFLQELIKLASPRSNPPHFLLDKVLGLIQTWADAFRDDPELEEFGLIYVELKEKGCEFPMTDLDHIAPIHTPARSVPESEPPRSHTGTDSSHVAIPTAQRQPADGAPAPAHSVPAVARPPAAAAADVGPVWLDAEQMAKLRSELDVVQQNSRVFGELLTELIPGQEQTDDYSLAQDLNRTCHSMQCRIVELIERVQNEDVTEELLHVNDQLNNVSLRYERYERLHSGNTNTSDTATLPLRSHEPAGSQSPVAAAAAPSAPSVMAPPTAAGVQTGRLIDVEDVDFSLGSARPLVGPPAVAPPTNSDEFDMFAQSRQSFEQNLPTVSRSAYQNQEEDQAASGGLAAAVTHKSRGSAFKDSQADEMEQWLKTTEATASQQSATSSEFDKFLATRQKVSTAGAAEAGSETEPLTGGEPTLSRNGRTLQKPEDESALFSL